MGWFSGLVLLPLAPVRGVLWLAETLRDIADDESADPSRLREALRAAEDAHQRGEITDGELAGIEQAVLDRLVRFDEVSP